MKSSSSSSSSSFSFAFSESGKPEESYIYQAAASGGAGMIEFGDCFGGSLSKIPELFGDAIAYVGHGLSAAARFTGDVWNTVSEEFAKSHQASCRAFYGIGNSPVQSSTSDSVGLTSFPNDEYESANWIVNLLEFPVHALWRFLVMDNLTALLDHSIRAVNFLYCDKEDEEKFEFANNLVRQTSHGRDYKTVESLKGLDKFGYQCFRAFGHVLSLPLVYLPTALLWGAGFTAAGWEMFLGGLHFSYRWLATGEEAPEGNYTVPQYLLKGGLLGLVGGTLMRALGIALGFLGLSREGFRVTRSANSAAKHWLFHNEFHSANSYYDEDEPKAHWYHYLLKTGLVGVLGVAINTAYLVAGSLLGISSEGNAAVKYGWNVAGAWLFHKEYRKPNQLHTLEDGAAWHHYLLKTGVIGGLGFLSGIMMAGVCSVLGISKEGWEVFKGGSSVAGFWLFGKDIYKPKIENWYDWSKIGLFGALGATLAILTTLPACLLGVTDTAKEVIKASWSVPGWWLFDKNLYKPKSSKLEYLLKTGLFGVTFSALAFITTACCMMLGISKQSWELTKAGFGVAGHWLFSNLCDSYTPKSAHENKVASVLKYIVNVGIFGLLGAGLGLASAAVCSLLGVSNQGFLLLWFARKYSKEKLYGVDSSSEEGGNKFPINKENWWHYALKGGLLGWGIGGVMIALGIPLGCLFGFTREAGSVSKLGKEIFCWWVTDASSDEEEEFPILTGIDKDKSLTKNALRFIAKTGVLGVLRFCGWMTFGAFCTVMGFTYPGIVRSSSSIFQSYDWLFESKPDQYENLEDLSCFSDIVKSGFLGWGIGSLAKVCAFAIGLIINERAYHLLGFYKASFVRGNYEKRDRHWRHLKEGPWYYHLKNINLTSAVATCAVAAVYATGVMITTTFRVLQRGCQLLRGIARGLTRCIRHPQDKTVAEKKLEELKEFAITHPGQWPRVQLVERDQHDQGCRGRKDSLLMEAEEEDEDILLPQEKRVEPLFEKITKGVERYNKIPRFFQGFWKDMVRIFTLNSKKLPEQMVKILLDAEKTLNQSLSDSEVFDDELTVNVVSGQVQLNGVNVSVKEFLEQKLTELYQKKPVPAVDFSRKAQATLLCARGLFADLSSCERDSGPVSSKDLPPPLVPDFS